MPDVRSHGEGTIYRRPKEGRWVATVSLGAGRRRSRYVKTRDEAKVALASMLRDIDLDRDPRGLTVGDCLRRWLRDADHGAPATYRQREMIVRVHLEPALGHHALTALRPAHVEAYAKGKRRTHASRTVHHHYAVLRTALRWAVVNRWADFNAAADATAPKVSAPQRPHLTADQLGRLFEGTVADPLHAAFVLAGTVGIREAELLGLGWDDVDLDSGIVTVGFTLHRQDKGWVRLPPKSRRPRTIDLPPIAIEALRAQRVRMVAARKPDWTYFGLVFLTARGQPFHGTNMTADHLYPALTRLGLPRVTVHDLRHSAATNMALAGVPLQVIAAILGHSTIRVTADLYAHVVGDQRRDAARRIEASLRGVG